MKKYFLLCLTSLLLSGCQAGMKAIYGMTDPKPENEASLQAYLKNVDMLTDNVYAYNFESYVKNVSGKSIPDVYIFNKQGEYIPYGNEYACNAVAFDFIEKLDRNKIYETKPDNNLSSILQGLTTLNGEPATFNIEEGTDYIVILNWAKFTGKLNKDHVKIWEDQAMANKTANLQVIKINMDFQEAWGKEKLALLGH